MYIEATITGTITPESINVGQRLIKQVELEIGGQLFVATNTTT